MQRADAGTNVITYLATISAQERVTNDSGRLVFWQTTQDADAMPDVITYSAAVVPLGRYALAAYARVSSGGACAFDLEIPLPRGA